MVMPALLTRMSSRPCCSMHLGDHPAAVVGGGDVSPMHSRWRTELLLEVARELSCLGGIAAESCGDFRSLGCEAGADGRSDTAGASRDECHPSDQLVTGSRGCRSGFPLFRTDGLGDGHARPPVLNG